MMSEGTGKETSAFPIYSPDVVNRTSAGTFPIWLTSQKPSVMYDRYNAGRLQSTALTPFKSLFQLGEPLDATHFLIPVCHISGIRPARL